MESLQLPVCINNPTRRDTFYRDMPIIGINWRTFYSLRKTQKKRNIKINSTWNTSYSILRAKMDIDFILISYFRWPCNLFHPNDSCGALFFYPFDDLSNAEGFVEIENFYPKFIKMGDEFRSKNYLDFLVSISEG